MATQTTIDVNVKVDDKQVKGAATNTENLRKEIRRLEQELTKVEIGSKEFENLSEQLKDNRDKLELVRAKSRDLFDSFSMLPGPIGNIGSSISSTSDKLKIFSSFNLKDLKGQFKAVKDDIGQVAGNIGKATGITKLYEATTNGLGKAFKFLGVGANTAGTAAKGFGKALIGTGIGAIVVAVGLLIANFDSLKATLMKLIPGLSSVANAIQGMVNWFTDLIGVTSEAERAEERRQATFAKAKANTELVNKGIQRQINLLTAQGASQDEIDKKRKLMIANELKDLQNLAGKDKVLKGEQATRYKDLLNELDVIDAEGKKRRQDANDQAAKTAASKSESNRQKELQRQKEYLQSQAEAEVQLIKDQSDTSEQALRTALQKQYALKNEGKKLSVEVQQQQAAEIDRIVKEELQKDKEARQKAFDDRVKSAQDNSKLIIGTLDVELESLKLKYTEDSQEYRNKLKEKFDAQKAILDEEERLLKEKEGTKDGLTAEELRRLKEIQNERLALANTVEATNQAQIKSDTEKLLKVLEEEKKSNDVKYAETQKVNQNNFEAQQAALDAKIQQDQAFYQKQIAVEGLTAEQRKKIEDDYTATKQANADAQISIEQKKFDAQQKLLGGIASAVSALSDIVGKDTAAGKALAVAGSLINTYSAIAGQLRAATASPGAAIPGYAIAQAIATGLVGFKAVSDIIKTPVPQGGSGGAGIPEKPRKLAYGGFISGIGSSRSDLVPAMLSNGESVINAQSTAMFRPLLSSINAIGGGKRFADGGMAIGGFSQDQALKDLQNTLVSNQPPIKTYVVSSDMTNQQMMDRAIKDRSTL